MAYFGPEFPLPRNFQSPQGRERPLPVLWLAREMVHQAFRDAIKMCDGRPTADAQFALGWITTHSNWTRIPLKDRMRRWGQPAPPLELRDEYALTFEWCCQVLNEDPDHVRAHGLPRPVCRDKVASTHRWNRARVRRSSKRGGRAHIAGIPMVIQIRTEEAAVYAKMLAQSHVMRSRPAS